MTERSRVACEMVNPLLTVSDLPGAIAFYTSKLGFKLDFTWQDPPTYAGVRLDRVQIHLMPGEGASAVNFVVDDVDGLNRLHRANGVEVSEPQDREWGMRTYHVVDPDGNWLGFGQHLFTLGEPIQIERVDVPLRLERRMAAVLADLAEIKGQTISETIEETLCHTWEAFPDGESVPSPHTRRQLEQIRELKQKHGIEYDSHGSYRFVERGGPSPPVQP
jgi:catechol 2,3-dioxygenase-like lactoylglutathione lyase family enzyme